MLEPSVEAAMPEPIDEARRREILAMLAPGTTTRDGIERILRAGRGALIVFGSTPQVMSLCSGGFVMDSPATGQRIAELAKMDGALIVDAEAGRILRANVQLVPDPSIPTEETGTRHRSAERTAKQTGLPVVAVSESLGAVSLYLDGVRYVVDEVATVMFRANQAMSTLERYRARFDEVIELLATRELEDHVTLRDVALALQRAEMLRRIADKLDGHVVELGEEGRMIALQLEELFEPVEPVLEQIVRDYLSDRRRRPSRCVAELAELTTDALLDHERVARLLGGDSSDLDRKVTPRGYRMLGRVPRLPMVVVERLIDHFGALPAILAATTSALGDVEGVGPTRARTIRDWLRRRREQLLPGT
jgi:diadenylate cyclase